MLHLHSIISGVWAIEPVSASNYLPIVASFIKGEPLAGSRLEDAEHGAKVYNQDFSRRERKPVQVVGANRAYSVGLSWRDWRPNEIEEEGVAVIEMKGAITKYSSCEAFGMEQMASLINGCFANDKVKGVVMVIDSPGGEVRGMRIMTDALKAKNKSVVAYVSDACYSAAYGIASQCDLIVANNEFAGIGSIGTMMTLVDQSKYFEQMGINIIDVYARASVDKNQEYRDILAGKKDAAIQRLDILNDYFIDLVQSGRGINLTKTKEEWGTGKTWQAPDAIALGLIDKIDTLGNVIDYFV